MDNLLESGHLEDRNLVGRVRHVSNGGLWYQQCSTFSFCYQKVSYVRSSTYPEKIITAVKFAIPEAYKIPFGTSSLPALEICNFQRKFGFRCVRISKERLLKLLGPSVHLCLSTCIRKASTYVSIK
jgi:hypothetical protein